MTNKELIKILQQYPEDAEVKLAIGSCSGIEDVFDLDEGDVDYHPQASTKYIRIYVGLGGDFHNKKWDWNCKG